MTIGEPKHAFPAWVADVIAEHSAEFNKYPPNDGSPELLQSIATWLQKRYDIAISADDQVMALNGTREGLYNAAMALCPEELGGNPPAILIPNPFYQVYMVAALSIGAEPVFVPATAESGFLPDYTALPSEVLERTAIAYLCSPSNPQGAVAGRAYWQDLLGLAEKHDFQIFADECYSEIYRDTPPVGGLQMAAEFGADPERVVVFHSLSKRSNLAGLRSGFAASGPRSIARLKQLRTYAGAPLPLPLQRAATKVWADEAHVIENRALYAEKFKMADEIFAGVSGYNSPEAGFFLWIEVGDGEAAALKLWQDTGVRVLPGAYLSRDVEGENPGKKYVRAALVAPKNEAEQGLIRLRDCLFK